MLRGSRTIAGACVLAISQPALACNREGFELPWDLADADNVVVARISNFRIVPNDTEGLRIKQAIEGGTASDWQKKQYADRLSKGLPAGGIFGLFDVSVSEVLKGKSAKKFTVIFPDARLCCFGVEEPSMLPKTLVDREAILGLQASRRDYYNGLKLPVLFTNSCVGPMMFELKGRSGSPLLREARRYFGSRRRI